MSFILDALKKSDSERQRQAGPALFEVRSAAPRGGLPLWALVLGVLLAVNLVALGWYVWRSPAPAAGRANALPATPAAQRPVERSAPPARAAAAPGGEAVRAAAPRARPAPVLPPRPATTPGITPADESANPADYEEALPAGTGVSTPPRRDAGIVPTLDQLPPAFRGQLPSLHLDMHVYATRAADRFVFLNLQRLHEGEATRDGVRVEEITPAGVILDFRGTRFQLERE